MLAILALAAMQAAMPAPLLKPASAIDCADAAHRAYDFFLGDWDVFDTRSNVLVARSRIEKVMGGCAMRETFDQSVGPGGAPIDYHGSSYTALNTGDRLWRQLYIDTAGAAFSYTGGLQNGAMVLTAAAGQRANRMTVAPQADGTVRQTGVLSRDGGKTWQPGYSFTYRRRAA